MQKSIQAGYVNLRHRVMRRALRPSVNLLTPFMLGNNQTNLAIPGSRELALINNDGPVQFGNDTGAQVVRIIVTQ
jgi:hypothetical protein